MKIESFAYLPEQEFGNAFSTFIAQNHGAKERERIRNGIRSAVKIITIYGVVVSALIILLAKPLVSIFIDANETEIIQTGTQYLFIVAGFYCLIGYLFMFYGLFRGSGRPGVSIILTVVSLGTRGDPGLYTFFSTLDRPYRHMVGNTCWLGSGRYYRFLYYEAKLLSTSAAVSSKAFVFIPRSPGLHWQIHIQTLIFAYNHQKPVVPSGL